MTKIQLVYFPEIEFLSITNLVTDKECDDLNPIHRNKTGLQVSTSFGMIDESGEPLRSGRIATA